MKLKETSLCIWLRSYYIKIFRGQKSKDYYISKVSRKAPWVYIAYIADVFYHLNDEGYLSSHQNKRRVIAMVEVFNKVGYNVYVQDYLSKKRIPRITPQIIIGHEPNMVRASLLYPKAWKIYFATGAYSEHQNNQIKKITDYVNRKYGCHIPYKRLVDDIILDAYKLADNILLIGSKYITATFPEELRSKITTIHQSSQLNTIVSPIRYSTKNEFFFMVSSGNLMKGLSLLIEFFSEHTEYILNIVGRIEEYVKEVLFHKITKNIILHGYVDINSNKMTGIVDRCNFIIFPSGSEGLPGAVINAMKFGLIPIVTKWSAFDEIEDYGYLMENWDTESIHKGVLWAQSMNESEVLIRKKNCAQYVNQTYTLGAFKKDLIDFLQNHPQNIHNNHNVVER